MVIVHHFLQDWGYVWNNILTCFYYYVLLYYYFLNYSLFFIIIFLLVYSMFFGNILYIYIDFWIITKDWSTGC